MPSPSASRPANSAAPREIALLSAAVLLLGVSLLGHLGHPLLWQDEAETVMYASRILEHGYPVVHGERNVVYEFGPDKALGIKEEVDAYIGTTWGHFYFAVPGVLWASGTDDLVEKTVRLRLPFALAGALGLAAFVWAALPAFRGDRTRALRFAACFTVLSATSISLALHLREVRYYPLLVLWLGVVLALYLRRTVFCSAPQLGRAAHAAAMTTSLVLLFHTFHVAWFATVALLGLHAVSQARRRDAGHRGLLETVAPLLASALLVAPAIAYFEIFAIAGGFSDSVGLSVAGYAANLGEVARHFARHEWLVPAGLAHAVLGWCRRRGLARDTGVADEAWRASGFLGAFALGYVAVACINPLVYERYFAVLSPLVTTVFLLDAFALAAAAPGFGRAARRAAAAGLAVAVAGTLLLRAPELRGRFAELTTPYRGPVDFAIDHIRGEYADPATLIIATNYSAHVYMYYLGSHVIVGLSGNNLLRDREQVPDIVIPRRGFRPGRRELARYLARGGYRATALPVEDRHFNNVPALSHSAAMPDPHRYRTPATTDPDRQLVIYERTTTSP